MRLTLLRCSVATRTVPEGPTSGRTSGLCGVLQGTTLLRNPDFEQAARSRRDGALFRDPHLTIAKHAAKWSPSVGLKTVGSDSRFDRETTDTLGGHITTWQHCCYVGEKKKRDSRRELRHLDLAFFSRASHEICPSQVPGRQERLSIKQGCDTDIMAAQFGESSADTQRMGRRGTALRPQHPGPRGKHVRNKGRRTNQRRARCGRWATGLRENVG